MAVHNTNQHRFVLACVCALALDPCDTVAKNLGYIIGNLIGVCGDDGKLICGFCTLDNIVANKVAHKTVGYAKGNGLVVKTFTVGINKERSRCHKEIHPEGHFEEIKLGSHLVYIFRNGFCATAGGRMFKAKACHYTA